MRFFLFVIFFAFAHAKNIPTEQRRDETVWSKLEKYQKLTGITDEKIMTIWEKSQVIKPLNQQGFYVILSYSVIVFRPINKTKA